MKIRLLIFFATLSVQAAVAQSSDTQIWTEYMLNYSFANSFNLENAFVYSTNFNAPRWRSLDYTPTLDYSLLNWLDLSTAVTIAYTAQTENYNTLEIRPVVGTRIHITPNSRVLTRIYIRMEQRNFKNLETKEWDLAYRPRIRFESIIPLNRKSYYEDKLWYGVADFELMYASDDVKERFANRYRIRAGIGYRLNSSSRFEILYMNQRSRNGIDENFSTVDNIVRVRYRQYIRKHKKEQMTGGGN